MTATRNVVDIFLQPGDWYFGRGETRIRTLLGSCVAITLWHPQHQLGGMCHYMLPSRSGMRRQAEDGRYADEAFALLCREIDKTGTRIEDYEVKLFGGGNMFPGGGRCLREHVGSKNAVAGQRLLDQRGVNCKVADLGGVGHRTVLFDLWSGHVWVRRAIHDAPPEQCQRCALRNACHG